MTRDEVQAVIDKGGWLIWLYPLPNETGIYLFRPSAVKREDYGWVCTGSELDYDKGVFKDCEIIEVNTPSWREATPEEIERYVK